MIKKLKNWLHWLIYGEWKIDVVEEKDSEDSEDSIVATPFIQSGYDQK